MYNFFDLTKGNKNNTFNNLKLAIQWDGYNLAKYNILTGKENITPEERMELSELALLNNKSDFFELLMERVELNDFLTTQRLKDLYEKVHFQKLF